MPETVRPASPSNIDPPTRILLVEDEDATRAVMADLLGDAGFDVTATCTGDEAAILIADEGRFDLLLTDISMPGAIDGLGLAEHAREMVPGLPVLFVSGRPEYASRVDGVGPPTAFLSKPFDMERVMQAIASLLARSSVH